MHIVLVGLKPAQTPRGERRVELPVHLDKVAQRRPQPLRAEILHKSNRALVDHLAVLSVLGVSRQFLDTPPLLGQSPGSTQLLFLAWWLTRTSQQRIFLTTGADRR